MKRMKRVKRMKGMKKTTPFLLLSIPLLSSFTACVDVDNDVSSEKVNDSTPWRVDLFVHSPFLYSDNDDEEEQKINPLEMDCLAKNIYHEARGEGTKGMELVGNVTLNRVESDRYPDTICAVVYQRSQFSWTRNEPAITEKRAYDKAKKMAMKIIHQRTSDNKNTDPSYGALFFYAPSVTTPTWAWYKEETVVHGRHRFLR